MPEPEAELQATANLSPVSPSPVHTAASLVVPALQDTVDTIDAMVAAAATAAANATATAALPNGNVADTINFDSLADEDNGDEDVVDDDSFNDAYAEEAAVETANEAAPAAAQQDLPDSDDYAKTFDSPIGPEEGEDGEDADADADLDMDKVQPQQQADVSAIPLESNHISLASSSQHLISRPSETPVPIDPALAPPQDADADAAQPVADGKPASEVEHQPVDWTHAGQPAQPQPSQGPPADSALQTPSVDDIHQLVADLTSQAADDKPSPDPSASAPSDAEQSGPPTSLNAAGLPSPSSLPPRPPQPATVAIPSTPGQPSTYVAAGAPGTSTEAINNLPPPPSTGLNVPTAVTSLTAPPYPTPAPGQLAAINRKSDDYQRQWEQFVADERQYMAEAKWDRFPEGSRIFIGI
jgi:nuclear polyadenylated RNA-binding protein 3